MQIDNKSKKIYLHELVSARKWLILILISFPSSTGFAQEVWTLDQCLDSAKVYNKQLQISHNNIAMNKERIKEARANALPKVTINADYKYFMELPYQLMPASALNPQFQEGQFKEIQFGVPHNMGANIQLAVPLFNPELYGSMANTKNGEQLAEYQYQKTEDDVVYEITSLYYNAQIVKNQIDFAEKNLENANKLKQNIEGLRDQLMARGTDVNKVKLQIEHLQAQKEIAENKYTQLKNALKIFIGIDLEVLIDVESNIRTPSEQVHMDRESVEVKILKTQNLILKRQQRSLSQSRYLPSVYLTGSYGTTGFGYDGQPQSFLNFYPVSFAGVQLSYSLFSGTTTLRKIAQKKLETENNELQIALLQEKNMVKLENANRQKSMALQILSKIKNQISQAQEIFNQTLLQQKQGMAGLTEVLQADNTLRESQQSYLSAMIDYLKADLDLKKATGNLNP